MAYAYLGTSAQVSSTATDDGESVTLDSYSALDAIGNRISTGLSSQAYLLADLHGNVAAAVSPGADPDYLAGFRYDAFGQTVDAYTGGGAPEIPYRFQGRILQSAEGSTDLYDFGARSYDPSLGTFTSFDSVTGSAQNPLTLNRYLYALGNPATMIDPDGHCAYNANTHRLEGSDCSASESAYTDASASWATKMLDSYRYSTCTVTSANLDACYNAYNGEGHWTEDNASHKWFSFRHGQGVGLVGGSPRCTNPLGCIGDLATGTWNGFIGTPGRYIDAAQNAAACIANTLGEGCLTLEGVVDAVQQTAIEMNPLLGPLSKAQQTVDNYSTGHYYDVGDQLGQNLGDAVVMAVTLKIPVSKIIRSFRPGATVAEDAAAEGSQVYRVWGGESGQWGHSWTTIDPMSMANPRDYLGLPAGNGGLYVTQAEVIDSAGVIAREATPLGLRLGGAPELLFPDAVSQLEHVFTYMLDWPL